MKRRGRRKAIIIMSMHRSGTSALAGVFSALGVDFGSDLMDPLEENPKGFFESKKIYRINEDILCSLGSTWDNLAPFPSGWQKSPPFKKFKNDIKDIIRKDFKKDSLICVKDPRICRLFPLWERALAELNIDPLIIIPVRHPLEVAASLRQRNGFSSQKAETLWMDHMLNAEYFSRNYPRVFVLFDDLCADPEKVIGGVDRDLGTDLFKNAAAFGQEALSFVDPRLKHHNANEKDRTGLLPPLWQRAYGSLKDMAHGSRRRDELEAEFDAVRSEFYGL